MKFHRRKSVLIARSKFIEQRAAHCLFCDEPIEHDTDSAEKYCNWCQTWLESEETEPLRIRLPDERESITHKFDIAGTEGYLMAGMYPGGNIGEMVITISKEGTVLSGLLDGFATVVSMALQYGVPLQALVNKFVQTQFEPYGVTRNPDIPIAKSILDYVFRWLELKFIIQSQTQAGEV